MIWEALLGLLLGIVRAILDPILPNTAPPEDLTAVTGFMHWYSWANGFLPLDEAVGDIQVLMEVLGILGVIWTATFLLRKAHVIG